MEALLCEFPATGHLNRVEDVHAEMVQPLLRRRSVSVILVGGKFLPHFHVKATTSSVSTHPQHHKFA